MKIEPIVPDDLGRIEKLQPEGWLPVLPFFRFYISSSFCHPVKCVIEKEIAGIGASIRHTNTGWVAHIIVDKEFRRQGIGTAITQALIDHLKDQKIDTIHLVATVIGAPLYHKLGFQQEAEYLFFKEGKIAPSQGTAIKQFEAIYRQDILALDRHVSGEDRAELLEPHLQHSKIIAANNSLLGFYMPTLGEELILARTPEAGLELMRARSHEKIYIALPSANKPGIEFLRSNGYVEYRKGIRMYLGKQTSWHPEMIYSRIGGNLG